MASLPVAERDPIGLLLPEADVDQTRVPHHFLDLRAAEAMLDGRAEAVEGVGFERGPWGPA